MTIRFSQRGNKRNKIIYVILLCSLFLTITACEEKQDKNQGSTVIAETLVTEDNPIAGDVSGQYILNEKERMNDNKPITNEASNYAEIEQLMKQIAENTISKKGT